MYLMWILFEKIIRYIGQKRVLRVMASRCTNVITYCCSLTSLTLLSRDAHGGDRC